MHGWPGIYISFLALYGLLQHGMANAKSKSNGLRVHSICHLYCFVGEKRAWTQPLDISVPAPPHLCSGIIKEGRKVQKLMLPGFSLAPP
jgi:hypothetical protein